MAFLLTLLLLLTTIFAIVLFVVHRLLTPAVPVKGTTNIPGAKGGIRLPILGDALWFWGAKDGTDFMDIILRGTATRDKLLSFYFGPKLAIIVYDAKMLEEIVRINKCQTKEVDIYDQVKTFSNGLFVNNGKAWSDLRRPLDRFLHTKHMDDFHRVFSEKAELLCAKIGNKCGKGVFDMKHLIDCCTLEIVLDTLINVSGNWQTEDAINITRLTPKLSAWVSEKLLKIEYKIDWIYRFSSLKKRELEIVDGLRPSLTKIVQDCQAGLERKGLSPADPDFVPENIVEVAIQRGIIEKKPFEEMVFSFLDVIIAGFDTSGTAISSALAFLAMHPEYQERAYQEQIDVMKDSLAAPTRDELSRMTYLEMVLNESLRHVSVPAVGRVITAQFTIDGFIFPEGAALVILYHVIFKDPRHWERPEDFYPDHFLPENVAKRPKGAFLPFSFGARSCPGKVFANQSSKLILSMLLRRYKFTTRLKFKEIKYKMMIMVEFLKGYPLEASARVNPSEKI